jgi:uncharacterized cupredoxin-like copper-binding protein
MALRSSAIGCVMIAGRIVAMLFALCILPAIVMALPSEPTRIPILLADFKFVPSTVRVQPHTTYVLRLTNSGASEHDLAAPEFFMAATVSADSIKKVRNGRVVLHAGETVDIELTTGDVGSFPMRCTYFGHALMGMTGHLKVAFATTRTHCVEQPANPTLAGQGRRSPCLGDRGARVSARREKRGAIY